MRLRLSTLSATAVCCLGYSPSLLAETCPVSVCISQRAYDGADVLVEISPPVSHSSPAQDPVIDDIYESWSDVYRHCLSDWQQWDRNMSACGGIRYKWEGARIEACREAKYSENHLPWYRRCKHFGHLEKKLLRREEELRTEKEKFQKLYNSVRQANDELQRHIRTIENGFNKKIPNLEKEISDDYQAIADYARGKTDTFDGQERLPEGDVRAKHDAQLGTIKEKQKQGSDNVVEEFRRGWKELSEAGDSPPSETLPRIDPTYHKRHDTFATPRDSLHYSKLVEADYYYRAAEKYIESGVTHAEQRRGVLHVADLAIQAADLGYSAGDAATGDSFWHHAMRLIDSVYEYSKEAFLEGVNTVSQFSAGVISGATGLPPRYDLLNDEDAFVYGKALGAVLGLLGDSAAIVSGLGAMGAGGGAVLVSGGTLAPVGAAAGAAGAGLASAGASMAGVHFGELKDALDHVYATKGTPDLAAPIKFKWGNPASGVTYGHTFSSHGKRVKSGSLIDRARSKGKQIGQWLDDKAAADFIANVANKGPGVHDVKLPGNVKGRSFLGDGTELQADMATVVVKQNGGVKTAYPYNSAFPR